MEPERNIEKLLRAFAKKRRADVGDSLKLHPATRRLLQGEAARRAVKPASESRFARWLGRLRPGVIYATCVAVVVVVGAALLLPSPGKAKKNSELAGTKSFSTPAAPEQELMSSPLPPAGSPAEIQAGAGRERVALAGATARRELAEPPSAAPTYGGAGYESKAADLPAAALAVSAGDFEKRKLEAGAVDRKKSVAAGTRATGGALALLDRADDAAAKARVPQRAPVTAAATREAASTVVATTLPGLKADGFVNEPDLRAAKMVAQDGLASNAGAVTQQFAQQAGNQLAAQNLFKNAAAAAKITPVLANFQFQQNGSAVSVVDEDGSVYRGHLVAAAEVKLPKDQAELKRTPPKAGRLMQQQAAAAESQPAQNYFFRVAGTNRSLQQSVVFTGSVLTLSNVVPASSQTFGSSVNRAGSRGGNISQVTDKNLYQQSLFSNSRIAGTAVVNSTNEIEINALPFAP